MPTLASSILLVGDLHLTTAERDAYRWGVFGQLRKLIKEHAPKHLVLLGDLTNEKDRHPGELVNRIVQEITALRGFTEMIVHIVRGNHDGVDPNWPYFAFLNQLDYVRFYTDPDTMFGMGD